MLVISPLWTTILNQPKVISNCDCRYWLYAFFLPDSPIQPTSHTYTMQMAWHLQEMHDPRWGPLDQNYGQLCARWTWTQQHLPASRFLLCPVFCCLAWQTWPAAPLLKNEQRSITISRQSPGHHCRFNLITGKRMEWYSTTERLNVGSIIKEYCTLLVKLLRFVNHVDCLIQNNRLIICETVHQRRRSSPTR